MVGPGTALSKDGKRNSAKTISTTVIILRLSRDDVFDEDYSSSGRSGTLRDHDSIRLFYIEGTYRFR